MKQPQVNYIEINQINEILVLQEYTIKNARREYAIYMAKSNQKVNYLYESKESISGFEDQLTANEIKVLKAELIWKR
jgi:hypothetical protein